VAHHQEIAPVSDRKVASVPKRCVYCGAQATTKDHVPPKSLFPSEYRDQLVTVPSCKQCNEGASKDDEFFRLFVSGHSFEHSGAAKTIFEGPVTRGASYKSGMVKDFMTKIEFVDAWTPTGLYAGKVTATKFSAEDWDRFYRVIRRVTKGLLYHRYKEILPNDFEIKINFCDDEQLSKLVPILQIEPASTTSDIFRYGHAKATDDPTSIWVMSFYEKITFAAWVGFKGALADGPKRSSVVRRVIDLR